MKETKVHKDGREVIEVRSDEGKLLYMKTQEGYEMKCPRSKKICIVSYDEMLCDCLAHMSNASDGEFLFDKAKQIQKMLSESINL